MTESDQTPILVVGAGVTGLTLACVLRRAGASVRIIDKLPGTLPFARAIGIHSRTLEVFQDLGVVDRFLEQAEKVLGSIQFVAGKPHQHVRHDEFDACYPFQINLEQWKTEALLEECLGDLTVERQTELGTIEERIDGVRATLSRSDGSSEVVDTHWLVGCDGAHSTVRHLNRQHFPGESDAHQFLVADIVLDNRPSETEHHSYLSEAGLLSVHVLPVGRTLIFGDLDEAHDGRVETPTLSDVQHLLDRNGPGGLTARDPRWMSWYRPHYRLTPHYRHGRTFLAGDAAHIHSPVGGLGMNAGIQDAYNLGWKLALVSRRRAPLSLLDSYERERRAIGEDVVTLSKQLTGRALTLPNLDERTRNSLSRFAHLPEADRSKHLRRQAALDLDYRKSPICLEHVRSGSQMSTRGPHAGAEAINVDRLQVAGRTLSLFELIAGPRHTLLLFAGRQDRRNRHAGIGDLAAEVDRVYRDLVQVYIVLPGEAEDAAFNNGPGTIVRDANAALHERYGAMSGGVYLIRPDGHVGWRSDGVSLTALRDYFGKVFL